MALKTKPLSSRVNESLGISLSKHKEINYLLLFKEPVHHPKALKNKEPYRTGKELRVMVDLYCFDHREEPERLSYNFPFNSIFSECKTRSYPARLEMISSFQQRLEEHGTQVIRLNSDDIRKILKKESGISESVFLLNGVILEEDLSITVNLTPNFKRILIHSSGESVIGERKHYYELEDATWYTWFYVMLNSVKQEFPNLSEKYYSNEELHDLIQVTPSYRKEYKDFNKTYLKKLDNKFSKQCPHHIPGYQRIPVKEGRNIVGQLFKFHSLDSAYNERMQLDIFSNAEITEDTIDIDHTVDVDSEVTYAFEEYLKFFGFGSNNMSKLKNKVATNNIRESDINNTITNCVISIINKNECYTIKELKEKLKPGYISNALTQEYHFNPDVEVILDKPVKEFIEESIKKNKVEKGKVLKTIKTPSQESTQISINLDAEYTHELIDSIALTSVDISQRPKVQELLDSDYRASIEAAVKSWFLPDGNLKSVGLGNAEGDLMLRKMLLKKIGASAK